MREHCNEKGEQKNGNPDKKLKAGLTSLLRRKKEGEMIIAESDKGKTITVMSPECHHRIGMEMTQGDREIGDRKVRTTQRKMAAHGRALSKIFNVGESKGPNNQDRCFANASSEACSVPILKVARKTHKPLKANGDPKARAIVAADNCVTSRPGDVTTDVLEAVTAAGGGEECKRTEEMLHHLERCGKAVQ